MANQTLLSDVSDEMKLNDNVQPNDVKEQHLIRKRLMPIFIRLL